MDIATELSDLGILALATFVAATVRGFSGFGSGLIYLPIASHVLSPFAAITTIVIFDLLGPLPIVRKAFRDCHPPDLARLVAGLVLALPLGIYALTLLSPEIFRYAVSIIAMVLLACLICGVRYRGKLSRPLVVATGGCSGFLQGIAGIPGPPVIFLYMASTLPTYVIRANMLLFLFLTDVVAIPMLAVFDRLDSTAVLLGVILIIPNLLGGLLGAKLFNPAHERSYRLVAYTVIFLSAVYGLPVLD